MPDNLKEGNARIITLNGGGNIGVGSTEPLTSLVNVHAPLTDWLIKKVEGKENTYLLTVSTYTSTFTAYNHVFAANDHANQEWVITYHAPQDAYTIEVAGSEGTLWVVQGNPADPSAQELQIQTFPSDPPYPSIITQIFRFEYDN